MKKQKSITENSAPKTVIPIRAIEIGEIEHGIPLPNRGASAEWFAKIKEMKTGESRVIKGRTRSAIAAASKRRGLSIATSIEDNGVRVWMK